MLIGPLLLIAGGVIGTHAWALRYAARRRPELEAVCADHDDEPRTWRSRLTTFASECGLTLLLPVLGVVGPPVRVAQRAEGPRPVLLVYPRWARGLAWPIAGYLAQAGWQTVVPVSVDRLLTPALAALDAATARVRTATGEATVDVIALGAAGLVARIFASAEACPVRRLVTVATPHHGTFAPWPFGRADLRPDGRMVRYAQTMGSGRSSVTCSVIYSSDDPALLPATNAYLHGALAAELRGLGHLATFASPRVAALIAEELGDRSAAALPVTT